MMMTQAISTQKHAGVWIDHRKAHVVGVAPGAEFTTVILSKVEKYCNAEAIRQ